MYALSFKGLFSLYHKQESTIIPRKSLKDFRPTFLIPHSTVRHSLFYYYLLLLVSKNILVDA